MDGITLNLHPEIVAINNPTHLLLFLRLKSYIKTDCICLPQRHFSISPRQRRHQPVTQHSHYAITYFTSYILLALRAACCIMKRNPINFSNTDRVLSGEYENPMRSSKDALYLTLMLYVRYINWRRQQQKKNDANLLNVT